MSSYDVVYFHGSCCVIIYWTYHKHTWHSINHIQWVNDTCMDMHTYTHTHINTHIIIIIIYSLVYSLSFLWSFPLCYIWWLWVIFKVIFSRSYCSRRIRRIRKSLHFPQGGRNKVTPKKVTVDMLTDSRLEHVFFLHHDDHGNILSLFRS